MKREENPGGGNQIITLLIVAGGAYLAYNYLVSSGMWAQWFGGAAATGTGGGLAQQIAAGLQSGAFVQAGKDAAGNIIVHQVSTGAYYAVNPTTGAVAQASGPGQLAVGAPTTVVTTPPVTQQPPPVQVSSATATQLQQMGNQFIANMQAAGTPVAGLNVDQWMFYYDQIKGTTLFGTAQGLAVIQAAGVPSSTIIPLSTFLSALGSAGLSGIVSVPNQGPIRAPIPTTQSFRGGYGGYGNSGRKGYLN